MLLEYTTSGSVVTPKPAGIELARKEIIRIHFITIRINSISIDFFFFFQNLDHCFMVQDFTETRNAMQASQHGKTRSLDTRSATASLPPREPAAVTRDPMIYLFFNCF